MRKMHLLLTLGLLCGALAFAQDSPGGQMTNPNDRGSAGANAVHGCLGGSTGSYTLTTADTGTVIQLRGDDAKLQKHVGQEVSITGKMMKNESANAMSQDQSAAQTPDQSQMANNSAGTIMKVSHISTLSKECKTSAAH